MKVSQEYEKEIVAYSRTRQRLVYEGAVYHITQRAPGNELIFVDDADYLMFLGILKATSKKFQLKIFSFSLLPNHIHLLMKITTKNLAEAMKNLFETYAMRFNKKYERKGHVFCGRFRSSTCHDNSYFLTASIYIHLNAARAGRCSNTEDYRWHSMRLFVDHEAPQSFVDTDAILFLLSKDRTEAKKIYQEILRNNLDLKPGHSTEHGALDRIIKRGMSVVKEIIEKNIKTRENAQFQPEGDESSKERRYLVLQLLANGYTAEEIQKKLKVSRATFYRVIGSQK